MANRTIIATANESWNLLNFRGGLLRSLISDGFTVIVVAPYDRHAVDELRDMGCHWQTVPIDPAGIRPWRDIDTVRTYSRLIAQYRPAAVLSWTIKPNMYATWAAGLAGVVSIPNISGLGTAFMRPGALEQIARLMYRFSLRRAATVFFQNEDDKNLFVNGKLITERAAVVLPGSGVDTSHFAPISSERNARGHFLMISRLIADKGVREFVEAARRARSLDPSLRFTIMGQLHVKNRTAVRRTELQDWLDEGVICYKAPVDDVRSSMAAADFVVLPSYREGMSRVLLESSAMARPLIASDVPGCRDIVKDGENGFLCAPRDADSLLDAIMRAACISDQEWMRMALAARKNAIERFSEAVVIKAYRDALRRSGVELSA